MTSQEPTQQLQAVTANGPISEAEFGGDSDVKKTGEVSPAPVEPVIPDPGSTELPDISASPNGDTAVGGEYASGATEQAEVGESTVPDNSQEKEKDEALVVHAESQPHRRVSGSGSGHSSEHSSGNPSSNRKLPPSFDPSTCRTLYVGNLHPYINEQMLQEVFSGYGAVSEVKVIKDRATGQSAGYGFVKLIDHQNADTVMTKVNGMMLYGQEVRLNWAFTSSHREEGPAGNNLHVFVGDLSNEVSDKVLLQAFSDHWETTEARVMWDHNTGRSKGYGFVSFKTTKDAEAAIKKMNGETLGGRRIRCGWAQHKQSHDSSTSGEGNHGSNRTDPNNTNVYIGNIAPETQDADLRRHFSTFGTIVELKQHKKGGYGFVRYQKHEEAVKAICGMNGKSIGGMTLKCSWGRHAGNGMQQGMNGAAMSIANGLQMLTMNGGMQHNMAMMSGQGYMPHAGMHLPNGQAMMANGQAYAQNLQAMAAHNPAMQAIMAAGHQQMQGAHMHMGSQMQMPGQVMMPLSQGHSHHQQMLMANHTVPMGHNSNMYYGMYYT